MKTFLKQSTEARRELILTAHPIKTLLILSLPSLLMNTVQAMMPFTDGLFTVFINDEEVKTLDTPLTIEADTIITFIRLTFLVGGYW